MTVLRCTLSVFAFALFGSACGGSSDDSDPVRSAPEGGAATSGGAATGGQDPTPVERGGDVSGEAGGSSRAGAGGTPAARGGAGHGGVDWIGGGADGAGRAGAVSGGLGGDGGAPSSGGTAPSSGGAAGSAGTAAGGGAAGAGGLTAGAAGRGGAAGGSAGAAGASNLEVQCFGGADPVFPSFDRTCGDATDCVLMHHVQDCCGTVLVMAIADGEADRFSAAEAICDGQYPPCGCAAQGVFAEDGVMAAVGDEASIVAACDAGQCHSVYSDFSIPCGDTECARGQYCNTQMPGTGGAGPVSGCVATDCTDCECLNVRPGCRCTDNGSAVLSVECDGV